LLRNLRKQIQARSETILYLLLVATLVLMLVCSLDFGITWDERYQDVRGHKLLSFWSNLFSEFKLPSSKNYYGSFFEVLSVIAQKSITSFEHYEVRHFLGAIFGWGGILFSVLFVKKHFGLLPGFLTLILLVCSPRYFAHSMNNTKDIPFAALYMAAIYFISLINNRDPFGNKKLLAVLACAIGAAIGVRVAGCVLFALLGIWLILPFIQESSFRNVDRAKSSLKALLGTLIISLAVAAIFWPWILTNPFLRITETVQVFSNYVKDFKNVDHVVVFFGEVMKAADTPWYFLPTWLGITPPILVLILFIAGNFLVKVLTAENKALYLVFATFWGPFAYALAVDATFYHDARQFIFIYPPMTIIAGVAFSYIIRYFSKNRFAIAIAACIFCGLLYDPIKFHLKNHPNQVVYFNQLVGGIQGAHYKFDLDYWGNCFKQSVDWVAKTYKPDRPGNKIRLNAVWSGPHVAYDYAKKYSYILPVRNIRHVADFRIFSLFAYPEDVKKVEKFPNIVHRVTADGVPLCVVEDLRRY
jgi:hypothetical protein